MLLVLLESCWQVGVHQGDLAMFKPSMQELLNIEKNFKKISNNNFEQFLGIVENPWCVKFIGGDFVVFRLKLKKVLNFE